LMTKLGKTRPPRVWVVTKMWVFGRLTGTQEGHCCIDAKTRSFSGS
jgi:hypothetical protein